MAAFMGENNESVKTRSQDSMARSLSADWVGDDLWAWHPRRSEPPAVCLMDKERQCSESYMRQHTSINFDNNLQLEDEGR